MIEQDQETRDWLQCEEDSGHMSVDERAEFFRVAWESQVRAYLDRVPRVTRILVKTDGIRGLAQRKVYYDIEDFRRIFKYVTRHRQCQTGIMRKGELCGKQIIQYVQGSHEGTIRS